MWQVVGQSRAVSLLERSLEGQSLAHAYLFVGPRHVGKMALALNLAQALNCEAAERPCGKCGSCKKIDSGKHVDVQTVGLTQNGDSAEARFRAEISIDQIREIQRSSSLPPFEGNCKVFIIDGAESLSSEAANCLLKTLEEPPGRAVFVLLTANEGVLPSTVISRCQRLELAPISVGDVEEALCRHWGVEQPKAGFLARLSHGRLGWALSAAFDDGLLQQRAENLDRLLTVINADYEERFAYVAQLAAMFQRSRDSVQGILDLWLEWWRDLMLVKAGCGDSMTNIDFEAVLVEMARGYSLAQMKTFIDAIRAAKEQLMLNANPRLVLEVLMLGIPGRKYG